MFWILATDDSLMFSRNFRKNLWFIYSNFFNVQLSHFPFFVKLYVTLKPTLKKFQLTFPKLRVESKIYPTFLEYHP